jgi:DNA sulfur modification protein DndD
MLLKTLTVKNFMPFKGIQAVEFPQSSVQNVTVIFGDNMRGKTSILNAFRWGFYQVAIGRHSKPIPLYHLPNKDAGLEGDWDMEVQLKFTADGHEYDLRRSAIKRKHVARPERDDDYEVTVNMLKDGMALLAHQIPVEINRFAPEQVSRFFLFDGELLQEYETLLIEGNEQGKRIKEAIEQVLGVPSLINGRDCASYLLKKAQKQQNQEMLQFSGTEKMIGSRKSLQDSLEAIELDVKKLQLRLVDIKDERAQLDDQLDKVESFYQAKAKIDSKREDLKKVATDFENHTIRKHILLSDSWKVLIDDKIKVRIYELQQQQSSLRAEAADSNNHALKVEQLKRILELSKCPTCDQDVTADYRKQAGYRLGDLESLQKTSDRSLELANIQLEIQKFGKYDAQKTLELLNETNRNIQECEIRSIKLENEIEKLQLEIQGCDTAEIARMRGRRDGLIRDESRTESAISEHQKDSIKINKEIRVIDSSINAMPEARSKRSSKLVEIYSLLEKVFSESIERLRDDLRTEVEISASNAFHELTTQKKYSGLQINSNYGLTILDENGEPVNIRSAGAEQIVALALIDGLSRTGRSAGPVVMDTPFGRLDMKHRDNILSYLPNTAQQLILLVHDGEIRSNQELSAIAEKIGCTYTIIEKGSRHSEIRKESR